MVETRQAEDMSDGYMYPDDNLDPYLQDADILDRPDLFYGPGKLVFRAWAVVICFWFKSSLPFLFSFFYIFCCGGGEGVIYLFNLVGCWLGTAGKCVNQDVRWLRVQMLVLVQLSF